MAIDFTDLEDAKGVVLDRFPEVDEAELEALLVASACVTANGDPFYRPYLVAAHLIRSRWQQFKRVRSAAGSEVEWSDPLSAYKSLMDLQRTLSMGMICPDWSGTSTFEAVF